MNKSLKMLPILLVLFFSSTHSFASNSDGPLFVLKNPNVVFHLDSENIPSNLSIGYLEDVLVSTFNEFNFIENTTLSLSYGGIIDGACENVYDPDGPPTAPPDPDRDVFCFVDNIPYGAGTTVKSYSNGVIHERSYVVINSDKATDYNIVNFDQFKNYLLHEFGHTVGLGHVTQDVISELGYEGSSVLCLYHDCLTHVASKLEPYDIAQLQVMYPTTLEQYPEFPMHCVQKVWTDTGYEGDYYFNHLTYQGSAYRVKVNLNLQKGRFDAEYADKVWFQPNRDCAGLELVNGEIFLPYIIYEHYIFELQLRLVEDNEGIHLNIVGACQLFPKPDKFCSTQP